jgi:hypothetical protein
LGEQIFPRNRKAVIILAATVTISESNGAGETVTADITNSNLGSTDAVNIVVATHPITPNTRSYAKYQRFRVSNMGGSSAVKTLKVWRTGALTGSDTHVTNARTTSYGGAPTYAEPVNTAITGADQAMPTSEPGDPNLGIGGSLTGEITSATNYSDYLIHQYVVDTATTSGASATMNYKYSEIA